jgi:hypothetical protein
MSPEQDQIDSIKAKIARGQNVQVQVVQVSEDAEIISTEKKSSPMRQRKVKEVDNFSDASLAINSITKADITEVKFFRAPP